MSYQIGVDNIISIINLVENEYGHQKSVRLGKPVDTALNPIPWYTYPAIEYLKQFDFSNKSIFEYGSGNSSIFWSSLANSVTSIETDSLWFEVINRIKPHNLKIYLKEKKIEYVNSIIENNRLYDVIVIDGSFRYDCAKVASKLLTVDGFIILDDSERYPEICSILRKNDLIQVDFFGLSPIVYYTKTTSLFLKRQFRLQISLDKLPYFSIGSLRNQYDENDNLIE
jgi:hypothetical protein